MFDLVVSPIMQKFGPNHPIPPNTPPPVVLHVKDSTPIVDHDAGHATLDASQPYRLL